MTVLWRERSGPGRVAFAVGRRVGGAVERNRGRRRMREAFRRQANGMPEGVDVVLIGRGEVLSRPFPALVEDVATLLRAIRETVGQRRGRGREARP